MSSPGDIHLTGRPTYEPRAREIFREALAKFRVDYPGQAIQNALWQTVDLAERCYLDVIASAYTRAAPEMFAAHFENEAPGLARFYLLDMVLNWEKGRKQRNKKGARR